MRIKLEKGKQTELILKAKKSLFWPQLAKILKISDNYLRNELKKEVVLLSEEAYLKLCELTEENYDKYVVGKLNDDWGRSKGGKLSTGSTKEINLPDESQELAEFYGIMLGDGNLTSRKSYKIGTYQIRIVGDSRFDKEYLISFVKPLIEKLFKIEVSLFKSKEKNALNISVTGRKLVEFMESKGFRPGDKIRNQLDIPSWIKNNKDYLKVCLRGLFDTDGCAYKLTNQNSYQIAFRNYNETLLKSARESLINLGILPSNITNKSIIITKKSELRKFLNEVGFSNSKHLNKVKTWNLAL